MNERNDSNISRRDFFKVLGQSISLFMLSFWSNKTFKFSGLDEVAKAAIPQRKNLGYEPSKTPSPPITRRPFATNTATQTPMPTSTRKINPTNMPTRSPIPTSKRVTPTPTLSPTARITPTFTPTVTSTSTYTRVPTSTTTFTPTLTATPDLRGYIIPSTENFEILIGHIATAVNVANVLQAGKQDIDMSDLIEDFLNFNREKYEEYKKGKRPYKYLKFSEYRHGDLLTGRIYIRATVEIPDSKDGSTEREYVGYILDYLKNKLIVAIVNIDEEKRTQIERDVAESNRLTCVKFTRVIWNLFGNYKNNKLGLFPPIFQLQIVNAGELTYQSTSKEDIFNPENIGIQFASLIGGANIIAIRPEERPELFDGKIMVFFRPQMNDSESGHVGIAKLKAEYDAKGKFQNMQVTYIEVDGNTGQAYYSYRSDLEDFKTHLYLNTPRKEGYSSYLVGWVFNRE